MKTRYFLGILSFILLCYACGDDMSVPETGKYTFDSYKNHGTKIYRVEHTDEPMALMLDDSLKALFEEIIFDVGPLSGNEEWWWEKACFEVIDDDRLQVSITVSDSTITQVVSITESMQVLIDQSFYWQGEFIQDSFNLYFVNWVAIPYDGIYDSPYYGFTTNEASESGFASNYDSIMNHYPLQLQDTLLINLTKAVYLKEN